MINPLSSHLFLSEQVLACCPFGRHSDHSVHSHLVWHAERPPPPLPTDGAASSASSITTLDSAIGQLEVVDWNNIDPELQKLLVILVFEIVKPVKVDSITVEFNTVELVIVLFITVQLLALLSILLPWHSF